MNGSLLVQNITAISLRWANNCIRGEGMTDKDIAFICEECGEPCESIEDVIDFSGTHCTNGIGGTHRTGEYSSSCCGAECSEEEDQ